MEKSCVLSRRSITALQARISGERLQEIIAAALLDIELGLEQIVRSRGSRDYASVASEALMIAGIASNLGATRICAAAARLERACRSEDRSQTYELISALSDACTQSGDALRDWLGEAVMAAEGPCPTR